VSSEDLRCALIERGQQVPQFYGRELNWSGGAKKHVLGVARHCSQKHEQIVRFRWIAPLHTARCTRFVSFIEDHDTKRFLGQCSALTVIIAHDNEAGRHDSNTPGAFRHECGIAFLRQCASLAVEPAFLLG
jgi:hypothetical protein